MLIKSCRFILLLLLLLVSFGCVAPAHAAPDSVIVVGATTGQLSLRRKGTKSLDKLMSGQSLYIGDTVFTGGESRASIIFPDGAQIRLNARSAIEITPPRRVRNGKLSLFKIIAGQVWARLRPGNAIETRTAVLGVRGTEVLVDVAGDGSTTLTVTDGTVDFYNDFGTVLVAQSQQSVAHPGEAPSAPVTIQNAGFIVEWTLDLDRAVIPDEKFFVSLDRKVVAAEAERRANLVASHSDDSSAHSAYGDALYDMRRYEEAAAQYATALKLSPEDTELSLRQGYAQLGLGHVGAAQQSFFLALNSNQPLDSAQAQLVNFDLSPAPSPDALLPPAISNSNFLGQPPAAPALLALSNLALQHDRPRQAQKMAEMALMANGDLAEAHIALGVALLRQPDHLEQAKTAFQEALKDNSDAYTYQANAWLSLAYLAQDDHVSALREARQAIKLAPQSGLAHGNLALAYFYDGQSALSEREGRVAVELNPESVAARVALGQATLAQGNVDEANRVAAQAVALDPDLPQARYLLGVSDAGRRDYRHAVRELQTAVKLAPDFLAANSALARVYTAVGRNDEASSLLTGMLPRYRQSDAVMGALGEIYYEQGKYKESADSYQSALEKNPNSALYEAQLARTLLYSNRLDEAIRAGNNAVRLAPEVGQYHAILGQAYEFGKLPSQAEREFRTALTLDPQNALALTQLAYRHAGTDLRPVGASFAQGFLLDPAISRQLLRGGTGLETTPTVGSRGEQNFDLSQRFTAKDGQLNAFGVLGRTDGNGSRDNADTKGFDAAEYLTYQASPQTNIYANLNATRNKLGLAGSDSTPDFDDRSSFRYGQAQVAMRQRLGKANYLWAGLFGNNSSDTTTDPGLNSFFDPATGFNVPRQKLTSRAFEPEIRFDMALNREPKHAGTLTFGLAKTSTRFQTDRDLRATPIVIGNNAISQHDDGYLAYTQLNQRFNSRLSLVAQLRLQRLSRDSSSVISFPSGVPARLSGSQSGTHLLPSLLATYMPGKKTTLRLSLNQRTTDTTASLFAPTETLITTERSTLPFGVPNNLRIAQIDAEQYLSSRSFVKFFAFRSTADDVQVGFADLLGFGSGLSSVQAPGLQIAKWRGTGAGMRYEHQLSRTLYANVGGVVRQTRSSGGGPIGTGFENATAPYEPKVLGNVDLNYIDGRGNKLGLSLRHTGAFFQDSPVALGRGRFGPANYVDVFLAKEFSVHSELFLNVTNLFDHSQIAFRDYSIGQRQVNFGVTRRF